MRKFIFPMIVAAASVVSAHAQNPIPIPAPVPANRPMLEPTVTTAEPATSQASTGAPATSAQSGSALPKIVPMPQPFAVDGKEIALPRSFDRYSPDEEMARLMEQPLGHLAIPMIRVFIIGVLGGIAVGAFGNGLYEIVRGKVSTWTIFWTLAGAAGMVGLALCFY